jgi:hypothetical protein
MIPAGQANQKPACETSPARESFTKVFQRINRLRPRVDAAGTAGDFAQIADCFMAFHATAAMPAATGRAKRAADNSFDF